MTQLVPRDDVPLEVIREGALEEEAQDWDAGSGDRTGLAQAREAVSTDDQLGSPPGRLELIRKMHEARMGGWGVGGVRCINYEITTRTHKKLSQS